LLAFYYIIVLWYAYNCIWQVENDEFGNEKMQSLPSR